MKARSFFLVLAAAAICDLNLTGCAKVEFRSTSGGANAFPQGTPDQTAEVPLTADEDDGRELVDLSDGATLEIDHKLKTAYIHPTISSASLGPQISITFLGELPYSPDLGRSCAAMREAVINGRVIYNTLFSHRAGYYDIVVKDKADFFKQAQVLLEARGLGYFIERKGVDFSVRSLAKPSLNAASEPESADLNPLLERLSRATADRLPVKLSIGELCDLISQQTVFTPGTQDEALSFQFER